MENNIPDFLIKKLNEQYGEEVTKKIIDGYSKQRPVTIRVNTIKTSIEEIKGKLRSKKIEFYEIPIIREALVIKDVRENIIQELDMYKDGEIYLQSLSSMLPPIILKPKEDEDILDMAAAPGGKTTEIAAITQNKAHITACEMNGIRAERLRYNIEKQGATSVYIMQKDSRTIDDFFSFDRILLDAPCSGSGTLNLNDDKINKYFTEKLIEKSRKAQLDLLGKALKILKVGHEMVYSTCSILKEENEEIVEKVLKEFNVEIIPIELEGKEKMPLLETKIEGTLCLMPNELYEGFFIAKLKKIS